MNSDYLQNATYVCAAPSHLSNYRQLDQNVGVINLKELLIRNLLPVSKEFDDVCQRLKDLHKRKHYSKEFENAFLVASGETLKNIGDYTLLQESV
jgi:hypothetical protein